MEPSALPSRRAYLERQKEQGRRVMGVFPGRCPRELFWAANVVPAEIWDPPQSTGRSNAHLQPTICSVVKAGLELVLQDGGALLDGFVFPHTCDSIQNLGSLVRDYLDLDRPCLFFYPPKAPYGPAARSFLRREVERLREELEAICGPIDPGELQHRAGQGRELATTLSSLYALRAERRLSASNVEFYRAIRSVEYLHPEDALPFLQGFLKDRERSTPSPGPCLVLSGVLPAPVELLSLLDELGVHIGDDDLLSCGRRIPGALEAGEDPVDQLAGAVPAMPACSTANSPMQERCEQLIRRTRGCDASGVLFNVIKFCEPELFYHPRLKEVLHGEGLSSLLLDQEVQGGLSGQARTRIEAFAEMMMVSEKP
jgi:benzoyl-CoA reductase/2-hydroxyglutaryl-CoA dehydratase subunit BcrC/BadD/HgdB